MSALSTQPTSSGGSSFAQQGQVDWVALGNHTVSFSVDVLSRLSKAGVDPLTLVVGRAACRNLTLDPLAQKRIYDVLSSLKSFSSYGEVIWFGFGVRHVIHDLANTEQGLTCVALSAALQVSYSEFYTATVLRALAHDSSAPDDLLPALQQWRAFARFCAGSLSGSKFPRLVEGFSRILAPPDTVHGDRDFNATIATEANSLAPALFLLAAVAKGHTAHCTFAGGIDCAWIGAVAEWIYDLSVEIRSEKSGNLCYQSSTQSSKEPQVTILKSEGSLGPASLQLSKSFVLPNGGELLHGHYSGVNHNAFARFSDWSHVLTDTFGEAIGALLLGENGKCFAKLIRLGGLTLRPMGPMNGIQEAAQETLLEFAARRFPELRDCLSKPTRPSDPVGSSREEATSAFRRLRASCRARSCIFCKSDPLSRFSFEWCLVRVARTVLHVLELLRGTIIYRDLLPSISGLHRIYDFSGGSSGEKNTRAFLDSILSDAGSQGFSLLSMLKLFSAFADHSNQSKRAAALSASGLCAFYQLFQDPCHAPPDARKMVVLPGHMEYKSTHISAVQDQDLPMKSGDPIDWNGRGMVLDFIAEETPVPGVIKGSYRVQAATLHVHKAAIPRPLKFGVLSTVELTENMLSVICGGGSHCIRSGVISCEDLERGKCLKYQWAKLTRPNMGASTKSAGMTQRNNLHRDPLAQQEYLQASWSVLKGSFSGWDMRGGRLLPKFEIHKYSTLPTGTNPAHASSSMVSPYLYAFASTTTNRPGPEEGTVSINVLGYLSDCPTCLIQLVVDKMKSMGHLEGLQMTDEDEMEWTVFWHSLDGTQVSKTIFKLSPPEHT